MLYLLEINPVVAYRWRGDICHHIEMYRDMGHHTEGIWLFCHRIKEGAKPQCDLDPETASSTDCLFMSVAQTPTSQASRLVCRSDDLSVTLAWTDTPAFTHQLVSRQEYKRWIGDRQYGMLVMYKQIQCPLQTPGVQGEQLQVCYIVETLPRSNNSESSMSILILSSQPPPQNCIWRKLVWSPFHSIL